MFWSFEMIWVHACCMFILFMKIGLKLDLIEIPLGFDLSNWSLKHVILCVYKCFPGFQAKRIDFNAFKLGFVLGTQIWIFQILDPRSSEEVHARAYTLWSCLPLKREKWRSSVKCVHSVLCMSLQSARAREFTLERGLVSHARARVERPSSMNFEHPVFSL